MKKHDKAIKTLISAICAAMLLFLPMTGALGFSAEDYGQDIEAEPFALGDVAVDGLTVGTSTAAEVFALLGAPQKSAGEVMMASGEINVVWTYESIEATIMVDESEIEGVSADADADEYMAAADACAAKQPDRLLGTLTAISVNSADVIGPRGITVGMSFEDVLVHFPDDGNGYDQASASRVLYSAAHTDFGEMPPSGVIYDLGDATAIVFICPAVENVQFGVDDYMYHQMMILRVDFENTVVSSYSITMAPMAE